MLHIGLASLGIGTDNAEVRGGIEAFVGGTGRQEQDIAFSEVVNGSFWSTKLNGGFTGDTSQDLMRVGVEVVVGEDAIDPAVRIAIAGQKRERSLGGTRRMEQLEDSTGIVEDRQGVVGERLVFFEVECFCHVCLLPISKAAVK